MAEEIFLIPHDYVQMLSDIKREIMVAQVKAVLAANKELLKLALF
jgi:hypothetical protein